MKTILILALGLFLPTSTWAMEAQQTGAGSQGPRLEFGAAVQAQVGSLTQAVHLNSNAALLELVQKLRSSIGQDMPAEQRAAMALVLGALLQDPTALSAQLGRSDLPPAAAKRLEDISRHWTREAKTHLGIADETIEIRKAVGEPSRIDPNKVLSPAIAAALNEFLRPVSAVAVPEVQVAAPAPPAPLQIPKVQYGEVSLPAVAFPSDGTVVSDLWVGAHGASRAARIAAYNFDDMDIARSIIEKSKRGEKQVIVGDYSNWFPEKMPQKGHGGVTQGRTEAMKLIIANLGPDLELHILKGLGSIGINHNKFTIFDGPAGKLLQSGSFNYTKTSQKNHWENVIFTDEAKRIALLEKYFEWLKRRARPFTEGMEPEEPKFPADDPIPVDPAPSLNFHGVPFPEAAFSPKGGAEGWLVKAERLLIRSLRVLMFSPFPTPPMIAEIEAALANGLPVRMIADAGQVTHAGLLTPLIQKGMKLRIVHGPDMALHHLPYTEHSKQHEKVMIFDGELADGLVKMGDSLNISRNAFDHNFENAQFWQGIFIAIMTRHFEQIWDVAHEAGAELLAKLAAENKAKMDKEGRAIPWHG